ncbi:MAG: hypothetical protein LUQ20_08210 [Candidatus Methanoperedens sp.]|jgi:hypothetical protein|nr:hypothetical protein [Candidatus Methanoperedens sp.]
MEVKDVGLAAVMIVSSIILTDRWLNRFGDSDPVIILSAMLLAGSLAAMILLLDLRLRKIEESINAKERSIRINIKGVEENLDKKMEAIAQSTSHSIGEFSKRIYR